MFYIPKINKKRIIAEPYTRLCFNISEENNKAIDIS